ncbi:MAG: amidohydrolase family protein [Chloroflexi bacterium]|nr:amidohydrolase family protein [Chloroflexota bacterium]
MPDSTLKIDNAPFVVTLDQQRRIIRDGSVLIEGRRIARVGKATELADVAADRTIDGRRFVVTPGLFNGHMHVSYAHAVRGIFPDDLRDRLAHVFNLQVAMTEEEEYLTTLLAVVELLKNGVTCFLDPGTIKYPDACLQAFAESGCRLAMGECVTDRPAPVNLPRYSADEAIARTVAFLEQWDGRLDGRLRAWAGPFSVETCSAELLQALKRVVDERGARLTLHHSSSEDIRRRFGTEHGTTPTEYLERLGVLGPNVVLAHVLGLNEAELDAIARTGTKAVVCPTAAMKEAKGVKENGTLPDLLARGVDVALGSDSANSSNHLDIVRSMNLAALQYKDAREDLGMVPAESALELGTLLGARVFGLGAELGSIEVGKFADLVLFDTRRPEWQALFNPINNLIYNADGRSVHTVIVDGRIVVEDYRQTFVDEEVLYRRVQQIGERVQARTGITFPPSRWPIV